MNRRELLKRIAGVSVASGIASDAMATNISSIRKHGKLTVKSHRAHKHLTGEDLHVFVDGVDAASARWYRAMNRRAIAGLLELARERKRKSKQYGKVHA